MALPLCPLQSLGKRGSRARGQCKCASFGKQCAHAGAPGGAHDREVWVAVRVRPALPVQWSKVDSRGSCSYLRFSSEYVASMLSPEAVLCDQVLAVAVVTKIGAELTLRFVGHSRTVLSSTTCTSSATRPCCRGMWHQKSRYDADGLCGLFTTHTIHVVRRRTRSRCSIYASCCRYSRLMYVFCGARPHPSPAGSCSAARRARLPASHQAAHRCVSASLNTLEWQVAHLCNTLAALTHEELRCGFVSEQVQLMLETRDAHAVSSTGICIHMCRLSGEPGGAHIQLCDPPHRHRCSAYRRAQPSSAAAATRVRYPHGSPCATSCLAFPVCSRPRLKCSNR